MINQYEIFPFNFDSFDSDFLIVNDFGEYHYISSNDFYQFLSYNLDKKSTTYKDLCSKFFACNSISDTLINICATRYRTKFRHIFDPVSLFMIVTTYRCNQNCTYCHATPGHKYSNHESDLNERIAGSIVRSIAKFNGDKIKIEFQGGEPTLNFEAIKYIVAISDTILSNKNVEFVICSNLFDINDDYINFIRNNNISISTSLDGGKSQHDKDRILSSGDGTFKQVINNIHKLRENGIDSISALLTVTKNNIRELREIIDTYIQLGFHSIFIRELNPYGKAKDNIKIAYDVDDFVNHYIDALEYIFSLNEAGVFFVEEFMAILAKKILTPFSTGFVDLQSPSGYATNSIIYNTNGDVFISDEARMLNRSSGDTYFKIGNVEDCNLSEWYGDKCRLIIESSVLECIPNCSWCAYKPYCGVDPVRLKFNAHNASTQCKKHKKIFRYIFSSVIKDKNKLKILRSWAYNSPIPIGTSQ